MTHEAPHFHGRVLAWLGMALGALTVLIAVGCWFLWRDVAPPERVAAVPAAPRLQPHPRHDLDTFRMDQAKRDTYGWDDAAHTHARIPVERAMAILATEKQP